MLAASASEENVGETETVALVESKWEAGFWVMTNHIDVGRVYLHLHLHRYIPY